MDPLSFIHNQRASGPHLTDTSALPHFARTVYYVVLNTAAYLGEVRVPSPSILAVRHDRRKLSFELNPSPASHRLCTNLGAFRNSPESGDHAIGQCAFVSLQRALLCDSAACPMGRRVYANVNMRKPSPHSEAQGAFKRQVVFLSYSARRVYSNNSVALPRAARFRSTRTTSPNPLAHFSSERARASYPASPFSRMIVQGRFVIAFFASAACRVEPAYSSALACSFARWLLRFPDYCYASTNTQFCSLHARGLTSSMSASSADSPPSLLSFRVTASVLLCVAHRILY